MPRRLGERQTIRVEGLLPRLLFECDLDLTDVLDLRDPETQDAVDVTSRQLVVPDWGVTQELGVAAHAVGIAAICSPSATGVDDILAVLVEDVGSGRVVQREVARWEAVSDLPY